MRLAVALLGLALSGCHRDSPSDSGPTTTSSAPTAAQPACTPRSAEKLGFPFLRVCPPGEAGFWINAAPMGCSAGEHDEIRCPYVTSVASPAVRAGARPIPSSMAALVDKDSAARLCYFRMGGHLASRAERVKARAATGLTTVLVSESDSAVGRFRFDEVPEWVFEESGDACENGLPAETCHTGWFPANARSSAIPWTAVRECEATYEDPHPPDLTLSALGESCPSPPLDGSADEKHLLPCALRSAALGAHGEPSRAAFKFACRAAIARAHPVAVDKDVAAYRCVIPESALGSFDVPGR